MKYFAVVLIAFLFGVAKVFVSGSTFSSCEDDDTNELTKSRRIPAVAYKPPEHRHKRAIISDEEYEAHIKRIYYEKLSELERHKERRKHLESLKVCDEDHCHVPGLQASIVFGEDVNFCIDCDDPHLAGSHVLSWDMHYGPIDYHVDGLVQYAVPNTAHSTILNYRSLKGVIALVDRCREVPIVDKILRVQRTGATAVIIVDDGRCTEDLDCGVVGKKTDNPHAGFAAMDQKIAWDNIHLPAVLVSKKTGERLKAAMELEYVELPHHGFQYLPVLDE